MLREELEVIKQHTACSEGPWRGCAAFLEARSKRRTQPCGQGMSPVEENVAKSGRQREGLRELERSSPTHSQHLNPASPQGPENITEEKGERIYEQEDGGRVSRSAAVWYDVVFATMSAQQRWTPVPWVLQLYAT